MGIKPVRLEEGLYNPDWYYTDFLFNKEGAKEFPNHHCKLTWLESKPFIKSFRNAIDVGVRDGEYARYLQHHFDHTYCFDFRNRSKRMKFNVDVNKVTYYITALGECNKTAFAKIGKIRPKHGKNLRDRKKFWTVQVRKLDDFNIKDVDYIKMDVEGYELNVIQGGLNTITTYWPLLVLEQNASDGSTPAMDYCINELGYKHVATCPRGWDRVLIKND
jgi:FkbM family methyltransferase